MTTGTAIVAEAFPPALMQPEAVDRVIDLLWGLPVSPKVKKYALYEWCKTVEVDLTAEMVERVTGLPAGEI